ncbi:MAG TPA: hydroxymethylbilane synthase [Bacteroidia bacterium]|nr:hydroxymethylbilane synthase [Bacteroidia bacterium]
MAKKIIIGSRGSELALWQANFITKELEKTGIKVELKIIKTRGDKQQEERFSEMQGQGFFTKEIEDALLKKEIDLAVHSYKDLPTTPVKGLKVGAVSYREDPSEMLLIQKDCVDLKRKLNLKDKALVGTSAARRKVQLHAFRPDVVIQDLRGNIPTRIQKLRDKKYDAIVVASAAIERLELDISDFHIEKLTPQELVPAPAQGVLALQIRESDATMQAIIDKINHPEVEEIVSIERKIFNLFRGGCNLPLGIYCERHQDENDKSFFKAWAAFAPEEKAYPRYYHFHTYNPEGWAEKVAEKIKSENPASVFITRDIKKDDFFSRVLTANKYKVSGRAFIEFKLIPFSRIPTNVEWIFFSSKHAVKYFFEQKPEMGKVKIGAIGKSTADAIRTYGQRADFIGYSTDTRLTGKQFASLAKSAPVLFPQAKDSMRTVQQQFVNKSQTRDLAVYETIQKPVEDTPDADIMLFTSPSNVEAFFEKKKISPNQKVIAMGDATSHTLKQFGVKSVYLVPSFDEIGLLQAIFSV